MTLMIDLILTTRFCGSSKNIFRVFTLQGIFHLAHCLLGKVSIPERIKTVDRNTNGHKSIYMSSTIIYGYTNVKWSIE